MYRLVESLHVVDGVVEAVESHDERLATSYRAVFGGRPPFSISAALESTAIPQHGVQKCRVVYDRDGYVVEFAPYPSRLVRNARIVHDDGISYPHKFTDRSALDAAFARRAGCDEIIIVRDGRVTDAYSSNLVFFDGVRAFTPDTPLLPGTRRARLLDAGTIVEAPIRVSEIGRFASVSFINALNDLGRVVVPVENILTPEERL
ncbi:MAG: chorismate-binding protein [Spirochaetaceae bacterium]|nr:MAG: chorismate-binding protein [Spirochaetaceae bacterium]